MGHLELASVDPPRKASASPVSEALANPCDEDLQDMVQAYEKKIISLALHRHRWHRTKAADSLGINRRTLFKKMKQYALE
jgi:DNA-binding NtrC family response regulator